jgi:hypothetical protein
MAFVSIGSFLNINSIVSGTTLAGVPSAALEANNLGIINVALDNTSTSDGETNEVSGISDPHGNLYRKLSEYCNGNGAANAGAVVSIWYVIPKTTIAITDTITITFANSILAKAARGWEFTIGARKDIVISGVPQFSALDAADPPSQVISGLTNNEHLFWRGIALEGNSGNFNVTTGYTASGLSLANTGTANTSMFHRGEFRILTGTGDTSDPLTSVDFDISNIYLALKEIDHTDYKRGRMLRDYIGEVTI